MDCLKVRERGTVAQQWTVFQRDWERLHNGLSSSEEPQIQDGDGGAHKPGKDADEQGKGKGSTGKWRRG